MKKLSNSAGKLRRKIKFIKSLNNLKLVKGNIALLSGENSFLSLNELESIRQIISKKIKLNKGSFWLKSFNLKPVFKKAKNSRMGKGKGSISHNVYFIKKNQIILEIASISTKISEKLLHSIKNKISFKVKIVKSLIR